MYVCVCVCVQFVTACADSSVVVWDVNTGRKLIELKNAHGQEKITAMTTDHSQCRLITAASNGTIKVTPHLSC